MFLGDHLGSTAITANSSSSKVAEWCYPPQSGTYFTSGVTPASYQFTGQREEASLGFYDYGARLYAPALGRFLQADTLVPELLAS